MAKAVAAVIRQRREAAELSMNRLAQEAGLSQQTIAFLEDGRRRPTLDTLIRLCAVFGIAVSELLAEAEERGGGK